MAPIKNTEQFERWLEDQPQDVFVAIATRTALRVFPFVACHDGTDARKETLILMTARCILTSGNVAKMSTPEAVAAADIAANAAFYANALAECDFTSAAYNAARTGAGASFSTAADSLRSAARASDAVYAAAYADTELTLHELMTTPIWNDQSEPNSTKTVPTSLRNTLDSGPEWTFWRSWYQGFLIGEPLDWELQRQVALIKNAIWEAGPKAIAEAIAKIEAELLVERLPQAEEIERDPADGRYVVSSVVIDAEKMIDQLFSQLDFSLDLALRGHNVSGFGEMCTAYQYLDHTRRECRNDPNAVHMHIRLAREIIQSRLDSGEYQVEDSLVALVAVLERHEIQLRADHPVIRAAHETFVAQRLREASDDLRLQIAREFRALTQDSKERLSTEFDLDAQTLEASSGIEAQADAIKRSGGRSQKMNFLERTVKSIDGSTPNKGIGLALRLEKLAEMISGLF